MAVETVTAYKGHFDDYVVTQTAEGYIEFLLNEPRDPFQRAG